MPKITYFCDIKICHNCYVISNIGVFKMTETSKDSILKLLELGEKYPLVTLNFMLKTEREQNIENNQEIFKITVGLRRKNREFENYSKSKFLIFSISVELPQFLS